MQIINSHMAHFPWYSFDGHRTYHLVSWPSVCTRKYYGGLGVPDLKDLKICSRGSAVEITCQIKYKKNRKPNVFAYKDNKSLLFWMGIKSSLFWIGVMWASDVARMRYRKLNFGKNWLGSATLQSFSSIDMF